jgi:SAM-dependent methyltransferase/uncharacterized protein YbaR (Trm112 family)
LHIGQVISEESDDILEGILVCSDSSCQREYPIIDGIPLLVADIRAYITQNILAITQRDDLSDVMESMLGDGCGPGSMYDTHRQHLSSYAWDHYADLDPMEPRGGPRPGAAVATLLDGLTATGELPAGPCIDLGCSVGRTTLEWATRQNQLVLGVDLNHAMLRRASHVLRHGVVRYPRRRVGLVYDRRAFSVSFSNTHLVDFWACDVTALPFGDEAFAAASGLNVLDCVPAPIELLKNIGRIIRRNGRAIMTCPYDWSATAAPVEAWLGGHSQRGPLEGRSERVMERLLDAAQPDSPRLRIVDSSEGPPWHVRLHDRSVMCYRNHRLILEGLGTTAPPQQVHTPMDWAGRTRYSLSTTAEAIPT